MRQLHGDERSQEQKHQDYLRFLNRFDRAMFGNAAEHLILKKQPKETTND